MTNKNTFIITVMFIFCYLCPCQSKCYSFYAGDIYPTFNDSYCASIIQWPVSDQTFTTYQQRDAKALKNYIDLYENYYKNSIVTEDCLGMAKYFLCADAYPTCSDSYTQIESTCSWVCDLWSVRCGGDNKFYKNICQSNKVADDNCSWDKDIFLSFSLLFIVLLAWTF